MRLRAEAVEQRIASQGREQERLGRLLAWALTEVERVETLSAEERRAILIGLGVEVVIYPTSAPERYTLDLGAEPKRTAGAFFEGIDWTVSKPTAAEGFVRLRVR